MDIYVESGTSRVFACATDWPGWSRAGKTEAAAIEALLASGPRYGSVVGDLGRAIALPGRPGELSVVERLQGGSGTDFGVPSRVPVADTAPITEADAAWLLSLLEACWGEFDRVTAAAEGLSLRTGPRGGGRSLEKIRGHVQESDLAYLTQLGARPPKGLGPDAVEPFRARVREAFPAIALGRPVSEPSTVRSPWLPRVYARRAAWHLLDHAWEVEDRAIPG